MEFYYFRYHILVVGDISKLIYKPIRHGLPYLVVLIISSPSVIFINPVLHTASAAPLPTISTIPLAPSTIGQDGKEGDFTTQAALSLARATQTSNIANNKSYYDISFKTSTTGIIKTIQMTFPPGIYAGTALLVEAVGIGPGTIITSGTTATGQTITYTITNAVNVPANTKIRIQLANVNNPSDPSSVLTVSITTRDPGNSIIYGPTATNSYNIKQIGTNDIADNSITSSKITDGIISTTDLADDAITTPKIADNSVISTKPSESFMKRVTLLDNAAGNALGWNSTGGTFEFVISEPNADFDTSYVFASVTASRIGGGSLIGIPYTAAPVWPGGNAFTIRCGLSPSNSPPDGSELHYLVTSLPAHVS